MGGGPSSVDHARQGKEQNINPARVGSWVVGVLPVQQDPLSCCTGFRVPKYGMHDYCCRRFVTWDGNVWPCVPFDTVPVLSWLQVFFAQILGDALGSVAGLCVSCAYKVWATRVLLSKCVDSLFCWIVRCGRVQQRILFSPIY